MRRRTSSYTKDGRQDKRTWSHWQPCGAAVMVPYFARPPTSWHSSPWRRGEGEVSFLLSLVPILTPKSKVKWENWYPTLLPDEPQTSQVSLCTGSGSSPFSGTRSYHSDHLKQLSASGTALTDCWESHSLEGEGRGLDLAELGTV